MSNLRTQKVGRPSVINEDIVRKLECALASGFSISFACNYAGISTSTFQANNDKQIGGYYYSFMTGNASTCFSGEQTVSGTADGVQTEAVYSQLKTAFDNMSTTN